jgi:hypothetical protein
MSDPQTIMQPPARGLRLEYVPLSTVKHWDRNPKLHDIGALVQSIELHGFRDPPTFDATLDGIVEGNGRIEALTWMQVQEYRAPEGVGEILDAETREIVDWAVPILFGLDAPSRAAAERYGLDHNNLVLAGGDFTPAEIARTYTPEYLVMLRELAEQSMLPVSVDGADLDELLRVALDQSENQINLNYDGEHSTGFSEGSQFDPAAPYLATIGLTQDQASDTAIKSALQAVCDEHALKLRITKR